MIPAATTSATSAITPEIKETNKLGLKDRTLATVRGFCRIKTGSDLSFFVAVASAVRDLVVEAGFGTRSRLELPEEPEETGADERVDDVCELLRWFFPNVEWVLPLDENPDAEKAADA